MGRKLDMRWSFGMRYIIATLKDGDDDGWAEAQLIKLAEDLDDNNDRAAASPDRDLLDPIEVPRHGGNRPGITNPTLKKAIEGVVANTVGVTR